MGEKGNFWVEMGVMSGEDTKACRVSVEREEVNFSSVWPDFDDLHQKKFV